MSALPLLVAKGITKRFGGVQALSEVGFTIHHGEIYGLIGPNGAGKTSLFNVLTGIYPTDAGTFDFDGAPLGGSKPNEVAERGIARTFQNLRLFSNMTVLENILVAMHSRTTTGPLGAVLRTKHCRAEEKDAQEYAMEIIRLFGNRLLPRTNQLVKELSYANRRRAEIARALASRPKVLLLDEPTAGMNPAETLELADQIRSLRTMGMTIFLIEHKLNVVNDLADKIIVLDHGEKIAEGTAEQVHSNPEVLEAYLGRKAAHHA